MRKRIIAVALSLSFAFGLGGSFTANAAPIECPPGQTATKTDTFWDCVNNGGNDNASGDSKNPNGNPNFRR